MKKLSLILLLILAIPALAADPNENSPKRIKAEQIRSSNGQFCYRCDYVLENGWVTKVIDTANDVEWTLKPKETLYILPFGLRPESIFAASLPRFTRLWQELSSVSRRKRSTRRRQHRQARASPSFILSSQQKLNTHSDRTQINGAKRS